MIERVKTFKNFFDEERIDFIDEEAKKCKWEFNGFSDTLYPLFRLFWYKDLIESHLPSLFKEKVESIIDTQIEIDRIYANAQAHSQCGVFHKDIPDCDYTLVYFYHKNWRTEYGGHLMIDDDETGELHSIWPESNSAVLFKSDIWHCALEPTVYCTTQRMSIAMKFKISQI